jgi:hypothetical protein
VVCYFHPARQALGVCKYCQRGICEDCYALVDDNLACRDRHEAEVRASNLAQQHSQMQLQRLGAGYLRNAIFYGLVGGLFAAFGIVEYRFLGLQAAFLLMVGVFLLYAAVANLSESRKFK